MCLELCFIISSQVYLPVDDLGKFLVLYLNTNTTSRVFYDVTAVSYLQVQPPCYCMHYLLYSSDLSFISPCFFFYLTNTPIFSCDFTSFFCLLPLSPLLDLRYFALLFMIHHLLVSSQFSHGLECRLNAWHSKPLCLLQNMTYYLYNFQFWFFRMANNLIIL